MTNILSLRVKGTQAESVRIGKFIEDAGSKSPAELDSMVVDVYIGISPNKL
jgi:hypothetical protein